jgi:DNA-binding TFAR19-related protein (PDSD5 family)
MKRTILILSFAVCAALSAFAQSGTLQVADQVQTPDGRTGKIESFKPMSDLVKVKFADGSTQYFELNDLKRPIDTAKPTFRIGDTVYAPRAPKGTPGVIESISGNAARVRFGRGKYDYVDELLEKLTTPQQAAQQQEREQQEKIQKPLRAALEDEARPFMDTIRLLAHSFNPKIGDQGGSLDATAATREKLRKDLEALAAICQKYPNITNSPLAEDPIYAGSINYWHGDWCRMAQQRDQAIKNFVKYVGLDQTKYTVNGIQSLLNEAERNPDGYIGDELQTLLFDRAAWMKKNTEQYKNQFGMTDAEIEKNVFAPLAEKLGALKSKIESDAANLAAPLPKFSDAALETVVKRRVAADYPGGQVLKVGLDSANWSLRDGKRNIGSDSNGTEYYLRLKGAYRIRTGLALIRLPNQPFCQVRYVELTQPKKGAGFDAAWAMAEPRGKFVRCQ